MKLKIAQIDIERTWRGGQNQVLSLVKGLAARGHYNLSVVFRGSALAQRVRTADLPVYEILPWGETDFIAAHFLNRRLKAENIDVVHAHSAHSTALAVTATLGTQIPVVVTRRVDFHAAGNFFSKWKYSRVSKFLAISKRVEEVLLEDGVSKDKVTLVHSGIDFSRFEKLTRFLRSELSLPMDAILIGQTAALASHKDQATFLKAAAHLKKTIPKIHIILMGEGPLKNSLEALSRHLNIEPIVHFLGFRQDALRILAGLDIFCLSSKEEGLGTSILDAMALRVPVVATAVGGIPELVEDGVTGYLAPPQNPETLSAVLSKAIQAGDKNKQIISDAYDRAHEFDIQNTISKTEAVYLELLKEKNAVPSA